MDDVKASYKMNQIVLTLGYGRAKSKSNSKPNITGAIANKKELRVYPLNQPNLI